MKNTFVHKYLITLVLCISLASQQCSPKIYNIEDFNISNTPNNLDKVGTIFAVDKNKIGFVVYDLTNDGKLPIQTGVIATGTYKTKNTTNIETLINFLGVPELDLTANTGFSNQSIINTNFQVKNAKYSRVPAINILSQLSTVQQQIRTFINSKVITNAGESKYFIMTETVESDNYHIGFDKQVTGNQSIDAAFQAVVKGNSKIKWDKNKSFQLENDLEAPLVILYKALPILITPNRTNGDVFVEIDTTKVAIVPEGSLFLKRSYVYRVN